MVNRRFCTVLLSFLMIGAAFLTLVRVGQYDRPTSYHNAYRASKFGGFGGLASATTPFGTISLVGFVSAWNNTGIPNPTINVTQGLAINIQLSSGDTDHRFFVDVDRNGPAPDCPGADPCSVQFPPSTSITVYVIFAPGTYTYYCSLHPTMMFGKFIVLPPPPTGGGEGGHPWPL